MAERRMISKNLLMDIRFLSLSNDDKTLYVYLLNFADDDGIVARSIMIDNTLGVNDSNYKALEKNGLIIPYDKQIKVITDWNALQSIRKDIYSSTKYLEVRSTLFLRSNYTYTINGDDNGVFTTADNWIRNGRPKDIRDFQPLINKYLSDRNGIRNVKSNDDRHSSKVKYSKDKVSIDKNRSEKNSKGQQRAEQATNYKYINSSSNGGLGEILLDHHTSTSSLVNNATRENSRVTSGVNSTESLDSKGVNSSKQSSKHDGTNLDPEWQPNGSKVDPERNQSNDNNEAISYLFDSVNSAFNANIPYDDERLKVLFDDLLNQYREDYIQDGIIELADNNATQQTNSSVKSLLVNHLNTTIRQQLTD